MSVPAVPTFIDSYRSAFERFDGAAIADHFSFPCLVTGDSQEVIPKSVASREEWIPELEQLLAGYRRIGVSSAEVQDLSVVALSPRLYQVFVSWQLSDSAKKPLYEFQAAYTIGERRGRLRITAIAHNETPKFLELLQRAKSAAAGAGDAPKSSA